MINRPFIGVAGAGAMLWLAPAVLGQNVFVSDYLNGDVYEYSSSGVQSTFASGLGNLGGLCFDTSGNLYVAGYGNGEVYKFTPGGVETTVTTGLINPTAVAFDKAGNLFIANLGGNDIIKVTPSGVKSTFADMDSPNGLIFNSAGDLFVSSKEDGAITKITPRGGQSLFASGLSMPWEMAFDKAGNLYVGNDAGYIPNEGSITKITPGGVESTFVSGLSTPNQMAFNNGGDLLVAQGKSGEFLEFSSSGSLLRTITIPEAQDLAGLALQPNSGQKLIVVMALGGPTYIRSQ